jgi:hypothetical protein
MNLFIVIIAASIIHSINSNFSLCSNVNNISNLQKLFVFQLATSFRPNVINLLLGYFERYWNSLAKTLPIYAKFDVNYAEKVLLNRGPVL